MEPTENIMVKHRGVQKFLTVRDIAERYGFTGGWVFKKVREGKLCPPTKFGRHSRWPIEQVLECLENGVAQRNNKSNQSHRKGVK